MCKIKIIDSIMGSGKTSWAIQKMNNDFDNKYIYITPYLSEIQRIKKQCNNKKFYEPLNKGSGKLDNLHKLLIDKKDIASTHALFKNYNNTTKELLKINDYILILDEVVNVVEQVNLSKDDINMLQKDNYIFIDNKGFLKWNPEKIDYDGEFNHIKNMALNNNLIIVNDIVLLWTFPVDVFKAFKEVYVLSYLFHAQIQKYYYDFYNVKYEYYDVIKDNDKYILRKKDEGIDNADKTHIKNKIEILEDKKLNAIGENYYSLSSSWFSKSQNKDLLKLLKNNLFNYFKHKVRAKSKELMWTTFKKCKSKLKGNGYTKGFVSINARATNNYSDKKYLAYCANVFLNPIIKSFFEMHNIKVNEDDYALSEMIQWIWRSAIRNNEKIYIYIPSSRMRNLLKKWLI